MLSRANVDSGALNTPVTSAALALSTVEKTRLIEKLSEANRTSGFVCLRIDQPSRSSAKVSRALPVLGVRSPRGSGSQQAAAARKTRAAPPRSQILSRKATPSMARAGPTAIAETSMLWTRPWIFASSVSLASCGTTFSTDIRTGAINRESSAPEVIRIGVSREGAARQPISAPMRTTPRPAVTKRKSRAPPSRSARRPANGYASSAGSHSIA